jgi:hypothetical protein
VCLLTKDSEEMSHVTKVMRYQLIYQDGGGEFYAMQKELWELQRQTREILNKTIQTMYLTTAKREKFDKTAENSLYHRFCDEYPNMAASTVNATLREAEKKYNASAKEILSGRMSLPSYKRDHPILLHNKSVKRSSWTKLHTLPPFLYSQETTRKSTRMSVGLVFIWS